MFSLICDYCKKEFKRDRKLSHKGDKHTYCSPGCYGKSKIKKGCNRCGSTQVVQFFKNGMKYCKPCLRWFYENRSDRQYVSCIGCGEIKKIWVRNKGQRTKYRCRRCSHAGRPRKILSRIYYNKCEVCEKTFIWHNKKRSCSPACRAVMSFHKIKGAVVARKGSICADCGCAVTDKNKTHSSHCHPVCDVCMYERRRKYKDRVQYGEENIKLLKKIRTVELVSLIGKQKTGGFPWHQKNDIHRARWKRLRLNVSAI